MKIVNLKCFHELLKLVKVHWSKVPVPYNRLLLIILIPILALISRAQWSGTWSFTKKIDFEKFSRTLNFARFFWGAFFEQSKNTRQPCLE